MRGRLLTLFLWSLSAFAQQANPRQAEAILRQAIGLHQAGDINGAIEAYKKYLALKPDSPMPLSNLGAAYAHIGRYEDAIVQYRRALRLQPDNTPVRMNLALAYYKTGQIETAAAEFASVHKVAPDELQPTLLLADCWLALGKNRSVIDLLADRSPDDLAIAYLLGNALIRDNQVARGQAVIDRILRNGDSAEARLLLGTAKLHAGDFPAALADLTKAVELNPKLPEVQSSYGQALLRTGDSAGALQAFRNELAANPFDFTSNMQLAVLLKEDDKNDEAVACLKQALLTRPGDVGARYQVATIYLKQGTLERARQELESVVKEAPDFTEAHVTLATVYYRLKRKPEGDRERALVLQLNAKTQAKQQQGLNVK